VVHLTLTIPASVFREPWKTKKERIRSLSPYGRHPNWKLISVIVKTGADLRQEQIALQLIAEMHSIWLEEKVPTKVYPFRILITSNDSGLIETIPDSVSIHSIKKDAYSRHLNTEGIAYSLYDHFVKVELFLKYRSLANLDQNGSKKHKIISQGVLRDTP
jgi:phosphatidylinositol 4-kinase